MLLYLVDDLYRGTNMLVQGFNRIISLYPHLKRLTQTEQQSGFMPRKSTTGAVLMEKYGSREII